MKKVVVQHNGINYYVPCILTEDDEDCNYQGEWEPDEQFLHVDAGLNDEDAFAVYRLARKAANNK